MCFRTERSCGIKGVGSRVRVAGLSPTVGCGVPDAPCQRNDTPHRVVEDADPYEVTRIAERPHGGLRIAERPPRGNADHGTPPTGVCGSRNDPAVGCGVLDAPCQRNDTPHRVVEDADPYYAVSFKTLLLDKGV